MTHHSGLISLQISTKITVSLVRKAPPHELLRSVKTCPPASGPKGMASFLQKVLSPSANVTHFPSRTPRANVPLQRAEELMNFNCVYQKLKIHTNPYDPKKKITCFLSPGDTMAAEYYNQNDGQDEKQ